MTFIGAVWISVSESEATKKTGEPRCIIELEPFTCGCVNVSKLVPMVKAEGLAMPPWLQVAVAVTLLGASFSTHRETASSGQEPTSSNIKVVPVETSGR